jgi:prepilin-type N-terminal cleavage/methylation domain-containing protein
MTPLLRRPARTAGFTLIEVMVAVGLTAIMLWGLLQLFTSASRFSSAVTTEMELCAAGRAALDRVAYEIGQAALPDTAYLHIDHGDDGFDTIRFVAAAAEGGKKQVHVRFRAVGTGSLRALMRGINATAGLSSAPGEDTYEDASFGVQVESLRFHYISAGGVVSEGSISVAGSGSTSPRAVLIQASLRDSRGLARITLSNAAALPGGGV